MSEHDTLAAASFFAQWATYQSVIKHDYMHHMQMVDIARTEIAGYTQPAILDMGCGDAFVISNCLQRNSGATYCGVDTSGMALDIAKQNLQAKAVALELINGDMFEYIKAACGSFDIVLAGYAVHHLTSKDKSAFFANVARNLKRNGVFIFYDVEKEPGETIPGYNDRISEFFIETWSSLDASALAAISDHVKNNDLPEDEGFHRASLRDAGFTQIRKVFRDTANIFAAYVAKLADGEVTVHADGSDG